MERVLKHQAVEGNFSYKIFFSEEAHFTLCGYVNKQNCRVRVLRNLMTLNKISKTSNFFHFPYFGIVSNLQISTYSRKNALYNALNNLLSIGLHTQFHKFL